ncbi:cardiotrophin-1-like [Protopterus annectens]|uniref:cardiotrophin-1-like n=1 Tax=Protopterus annectens TaxID=7888 RepID=UPI001CFB2F01|nr:cardiotrophin-1-like [Protopterus annectens]
MEVLRVKITLPYNSLLHSSNASLVDQIYSLSKMLKSYAEQLLQKYLNSQGYPFNWSGFNPKLTPIPGLPEAEEQVLENLSKTECLQQDYIACVSIFKFLAVVLEDQKDLNPLHTDLLKSLTESPAQIRGMASNLNDIMTVMSIPIPDATLQSIQSPSSSFDKKVFGYHVCKTYYEWVLWMEKEFALMNRS